MTKPSTTIEVRLEKLAPMRVARFHAVGPHPESQAWSRLRVWAEPRGLLKDAAAHPMFGFNNPSLAPGREDYGYEFWIRLEPQTPVESGIETQDFPGGWYAVTTQCGPPNPGVWMQLLEWVRNSPYRWRRTHELEHPRNPLAAESEMVFDLCLPIEEPAAQARHAFKGTP